MKKKKKRKEGRKRERIWKYVVLPSYHYRAYVSTRSNGTCASNFSPFLLVSFLLTRRTIDNLSGPREVTCRGEASIRSVSRDDFCRKFQGNDARLVLELSRDNGNIESKPSIKRSALALTIDVACYFTRTSTARISYSLDRSNWGPFWRYRVARSLVRDIWRADPVRTSVYLRISNDAFNFQLKWISRRNEYAAQGTQILPRRV